MQQIFTNILINAMQAMPNGGKITITTQRDADSVVLSVGDTGIGIKQEHLDKIFEPFFTTKEIGQGTGLGLSVTYGLVQDMGGEISARSAVGEGTVFTISFPCAEPRPASDREGQAAPSDKRPA
jgi:signal transduction histidine kinase